MKKIGLVISLAAVALALSATAHAGPILTTGNVPQSGDQNVLLNTGATGNPLFGLTNQTSLSVRFLSNETLVAPSNGQARVEAQDGTLTYLDVSLPGGTFTSLIFNLDASANGTVDFSGFDSGGNAFLFSNVAMKGSGSNFFTFTTNGLPFLNVSLFTDTPVVLTDAEQFRIGGASFTSSEEIPPSAAAVPEPLSLLLVGSGLAGCAGRLRRRAGKA